MKTQTPRRSRTASQLQMYFQEINATPLLSIQDEPALAGRIEAGDPAARDHMVRANLRLVINIARGFLGKGVSLEDLIAEGNLGLMRTSRDSTRARTSGSAPMPASGSNNRSGARDEPGQTFRRPHTWSTY